MTEQRSSSAVRNLRSLFENKANADNDDNPRGRSPSSRLCVSESNGRPLSKIRSSFIDVQHPIMSSDSPLLNHPVASTKRASAFENRTESFSTMNLDKDAVSALKKEVADIQYRRQSHPDIYAAELADEGAMESTTNTPAVEPREEQAMGVIDHAAAKLSALDLPAPDEEPEEEQRQAEAATPASEKNGTDENEPPANPDKATTGAEEEKGSMKPAMPVSEDAVSGGEALPPVAEDLRPQNRAAEKTPPKSEQVAHSTATPKSVTNVKPSPQKRPFMSPRNSHRPDAIATGSPSKAAESNLKSPTSERKSSTSSKSPLSPTGASKPSMARKTSRSSLTAPTAASSGRERRASGTVKSSAPAGKRETTKPVSVPSHLTAPTAASRARQEAENNTKPSTVRPSAASRVVPKQQVSSSRPAARAPTATRPESRSTQQSTARKSNTTAAPSESFLERMMRPTAASASKTHDKPSETKALPQRTKPTAKPASAPKTNGTLKPAAKSGSMSKPLHPSKSTEEKPVEQVAQAVADDEKSEQQAPEAAAFTEKPEELAPINGKVEQTELPDIPVPATEDGSATPQHGTDKSEPASAALESTPAFGQDEIR